MNAIHSWQSAYKYAVLEADPERMPHRIETALKAIEERLRQPIEIGSPEHKEIENAKEALAILKTERAGRSV
jgi:predicted type IV restriction endonuclease